MTNLANHCDRDKAATSQAETSMCMIVGWRRITGSWADLHAIAANGTILVREPTGYRVMHTEGTVQGLRS